MYFWNTNHYSIMFWDFKGISVTLFNSHALYLLEKKT